MSTSNPHSTEEYFCNTCNDYKDLDEVRSDWKCPLCKVNINIRVFTDTKDQSCFRVPVTVLKNNDYVLIHRDDEYRRILGITNLGDKLLLGLENYGGHKIDKNKSIIKLEGAWCH